MGPRRETHATWTTPVLPTHPGPRLAARIPELMLPREPGNDGHIQWQDLTAACMHAMRRGNFEAAWAISDRVLAARVGRDSTLPRHQQCVWNGSPLAGRHVLVRCHHGLGDTIQYARFLPQVAGFAREVTVSAQSMLLPLLAAMPDWRGRLLPLHGGLPDAQYDVDLEIMELPHALRTSLATLSAHTPYFDVVPAPPVAPDRLQVGVVMSAGAWDPRRSIPALLLAPLARLPGVALYNLQPGVDVPWAQDASNADILESAARVRSLDLVISVDTMMAHLAGALGVPTWVLLNAESDWRWMDGQDHSPWYPGARLFRQPDPGNWGAVVDELTERLARRAGAAPPETVLHTTS